MDFSLEFPEPWLNRKFTNKLVVVEVVILLKTKIFLVLFLNASSNLIIKKVLSKFRIQVLYFLRVRKFQQICFKI